MRLILLGAPGAGKGTQAKQLAHFFNIPHISTGDMLRAAIQSNNTLGKEVLAIMEAGQLVPDERIIQLIHDRLKQTDCNFGYIFDGFPRTLPQAEALRAAQIHIDHVIDIVVPDAEIIHRMSGRRVHQASGRVYHIEFNPPHIADIDDLTQEPLVQRKDDEEHTVRQRLTVYHTQTEPLIQYYKNWLQQDPYNAPQFHQIDGLGHVDQVLLRLQKILSHKHALDISKCTSSQ